MKTTINENTIKNIVAECLRNAINEGLFDDPKYAKNLYDELKQHGGMSNMCEKYDARNNPDFDVENYVVTGYFPREVVSNLLNAELLGKLMKDVIFVGDGGMLAIRRITDGKRGYTAPKIEKEQNID